tara:strand:+ start:127 stop:495 length:369 start_codon:yes stop_codon:yes gene_type:complete
MAQKLNTYFLGTTKKLDSLKTGCLFTFQYRAKDGRDPNPFIIMISPKWIAKNGGRYFTGVNLKTMDAASRELIIQQFGGLPIGSVSFSDIKAFAPQDPDCCVRTYNVRKVRALHKVGTATFL